MKEEDSCMIEIMIFVVERDMSRHWTIEGDTSGDEKPRSGAR